MRALIDAGIPAGQMTLVAGDPNAEAARFQKGTGADVAEAVAGGGLLGFASLVALALPGIGIAFLAAPVAIALGEIRTHEDIERAALAAEQRLRDVLTRAGLSEQQIPGYAEELRLGRTALVIRAHEEQVNGIQELLHQHGTANIEFRPAE